MKLFVLMAIVVGFSSCIKKIILRSAGVFDNSITLKKYERDKKEIAFFPMHHIGTKKFYADVRRKVDSLKSLGFVFYYEGVKDYRETDSLQIDTVRRKMRKILGLDLKAMGKKGGYIDTVNNRFLGRRTKYIRKYDLINQSSRQTGISPSDKWADVYVSDIVSDFEKHYGTLELSMCDFATPFDSKYLCKHIKRKKAKKSVLNFRNEHIVEALLSDSATKIAIVYGAEHVSGIVKLLSNQDSRSKKDP